MPNPANRARLHLGTTPWRGLASERIADQARDAEALGLRSFWLPESHFTEPDAVPAPLLQLAAAAAVTTQIELGTVSLLLPIRDPLLLAEEVAVLDRLSKGRLILGIGRGFRPALFRAFGVAPGDKRSRFESHLEQMVQLWSGGVVGEPMPEARSQIRIAPRPVRQPHPPIWVAAFGPKALAQAARLGLPYLASPLEPFSVLADNYRRHFGLVAESVGEEAARGLAVPVMRTVLVSEDPAVQNAARSQLAAESANIAKSRSGRLRLAAESPIAERALIGGRSEVGDGIGRLRRELGMTHLIARSPQGMERAAVERSLELLVKLADS